MPAVANKVHGECSAIACGSGIGKLVVTYRDLSSVHEAGAIIAECNATCRRARMNKVEKSPCMNR